MWVFGDQLNRRIGALGMARPETHRILFVEATEQITGRRYHRQRLHLLAGCAAERELRAAAAGRTSLPDVAAVRARASEVLSRLDAGEL